ncbi:hypothetical protein TD95_005156 [Thielaviopsis punctulata]|uniref:Sm domain-containing protein n=1 Tax=Thielaviopsis punctulata TaxID=72032 RepID=A0A0F4ZM63_9PEZI|nr:hypothetical protein TD95_005156 [Thielaviopsis punctulata]
MEHDEVTHREFLGELINKNLRVEIKDGRFFHGQFKCTDPAMNIVLNNAYEYRLPSQKMVADAADANTLGSTNFNVTMEHRALNSIVIPGEHIARIELEEFSSQKRHRLRMVA